MPSNTRVGFLFAVALSLLCTAVTASELPVLHLRKALAPPNLASRLYNPTVSSNWYPASPTWFGMGGATGDRNHTEILATYDDNNLYIAYMNIDRSTVIASQTTVRALNTFDSNSIWIQTPQGRRFYLMSGLDDRYPPQVRHASGEFPSYDTKVDKLTGWQSKGWYAGDKTMSQTMIIPWSTLYTTAPKPGDKWKINILNYNQTSKTNTGSVTPSKWAIGGATQPSLWGTFAFESADYTPMVDTSVAPEATLTLRPATGYGEEITLRAGNAAANTNEWAQEAITQSNWGDWDAIDYTIKEYMQYDISLIPPGRKIISAVLLNHYRGNFTANPRDQYLHVVRLDSEYNPDTVNMLTSPVPVENGFRQLVKVNDSTNWYQFDVTDVVAKAYAAGKGKATFALAGSSGDMNNGKIWDNSGGRADWYNGARPRLLITFGQPGMAYDAPVTVGSLNYTSVATVADKNKLTNGTFRYGEVEGITNTTYWLDPGYAYINGKNVPYLVLADDVNPMTGNPALRFMTPIKWQSIRQKATGIVPGHTYTFSGWYKGSVAGVKADVRLNFKDANGNSLGNGQAVYNASGNWQKVTLTRTAPAGTAYCQVDLYNWTSGDGQYMLYSDLQLEEGTRATAYSETMGVYYPDYPRKDGTIQ